MILCRTTLGQLEFDRPRRKPPAFGGFANFWGKEEGTWVRLLSWCVLLFR
jgi:hypothetical protein